MIPEIQIESISNKVLSDEDVKKLTDAIGKRNGKEYGNAKTERYYPKGRIQKEKEERLNESWSLER